MCQACLGETNGLSLCTWAEVSVFGLDPDSTGRSLDWTQGTSSWERYHMPWGLSRKTDIRSWCSESLVGGYHLLQQVNAGEHTLPNLLVWNIWGAGQGGIESICNKSSAVLIFVRNLPWQEASAKVVEETREHCETFRKDLAKAASNLQWARKCQEVWGRPEFWGSTPPFPELGERSSTWHRRNAACKTLGCVCVCCSKPKTSFQIAFVIGVCVHRKEIRMAMMSEWHLEERWDQDRLACAAQTKNAEACDKPLVIIEELLRRPPSSPSAQCGREQHGVGESRPEILSDDWWICLSHRLLLREGKSPMTPIDGARHRTFAKLVLRSRWPATDQISGLRPEIEGQNRRNIGFGLPQRKTTPNPKTLLCVKTHLHLRNSVGSRLTSKEAHAQKKLRIITSPQ